MQKERSTKKADFLAANYISTKEAAAKWGYSESTVCKWCREGSIIVIHGAVKISGRWQIPADAPCPKKAKK